MALATTITQTANPNSAGSGTTITYSAVSIGTAAETRIVAVCVGTELTGGTPSSATIDGVAMLASTLGSQGVLGARIFYLPWPTGTTANIAITFGASQGETTHHIAVYSVVGAVFETTNAVGDTDADPISSGAITIRAGGGALAICVMADDATARTWANMTEDLDIDFTTAVAGAAAGTFRFTTATRVTALAATAVTVSGANNEDGALAWLIFRGGISLGTGSYAITGTAATLKRGRKVLHDVAGTYAITGTATPLKVGRKILHDVAGSYAITGTAATLTYRKGIAAEAGSYAISGQTAALKYGRELLHDVAGAYAITGTATPLKYGRKVLHDVAGTYAINGTDAALTITAAGGPPPGAAAALFIGP